nr:restriction endonuclease subunit S [Verrucomicrobiota bacterium]
GWKVMPFGAFAESINERIEPADAAEEVYVGLDDLDSGCLHIRRWGKGSDVIGTKLRFRKGDLIFGRRRAYQRKLALAEMEGICSAHAMVVRAKPDVVRPEFLPFLMMSDKFMRRAVEISVGSLSPTINWTTLKHEEFDLPPLDQQRRIAEILWAVDEASITAAAQVSDLRNYQRAFLFQTSAEADASTVRIGDVAKVANGSTPSKVDDRYWNNGTRPWLPTGKVHDRFIRAADEFITDVALKERKARVFPKGSVLVAMIGQGKTRGAAAIMEIDASVNQNFACLTPTDIDSYYLFFSLDFSYERLRRSAHGSNQEALNCALVSDFPITVAPRSRQAEIAEHLMQCEEAQAAVERQVLSARNLLTELINSFA